MNETDNLIESADNLNESFCLAVFGQVESGYFPCYDNLYVKYDLVYGTDWRLESGCDFGISHISRKTRDERQIFAWNLPLEMIFTSTNPFGWPQLVVSVYGSDLFGNDVVRGYGQTHLPIVTGFHRRKIPVFVPQSSSIVTSISSWFSGRVPEFVSSKVVASGDGRGAIRVASQGFVDVSWNIILKDFGKHGYQNSLRTQSASSSSSAGRNNSSGIINSVDH